MTTTTLNIRYAVAGKSASDWTASNPVLLERELAFEIDTGKAKLGDGATDWASVPYQAFWSQWGRITGTLSAQTDLQAALDAKQSAITPAALTKTDDTNVTMTLGGSPLTALLAGASLTLGWSGQLSVARGGTGTSSATGTGSLVLASSPTIVTPTVTTSLSINSATTANINFNPNGGTVTCLFQADTGGNMVFRNNSAGGQFFDSYSGVVTFRHVGGSFATTLRISTTETRPGADNTINLGTGSFRWKEVFAGNATINTSDERLKQWLGGLTPAQVRAGLRIADEIGLFRWLDGNRVHVGVRAQQVARILIEEGVEAPQPMDFATDVFVDVADRPNFAMAFLTFDTWEAEREPVMREKCVKRATRSTPAQREWVQRVATPSYRPKAGEVIDADGLVWRERKAGNVFGIRTGELALFLAACEAAERRRMAAILDGLTA